MNIVRSAIKKGREFFRRPVIDLIKQELPIGVVIIFSAHIGDGETVVCLRRRRILAVDDASLHVSEERIGIDVIIIRMIIFEDLCDGSVRNLIGICWTGRESVFPVRTGKLFHLAVLHIRRSVFELIGRSDKFGFGIYLLPCGNSQRISVCVKQRLTVFFRLTRVIVREINRSAYSRSFFVDHVMAVRTQRNCIISRLENIAALRAVPVIVHVAVRCHILFGEGNSICIGFSAGKELRLLERREIYYGLFDFIFSVVLRIRGGIINLNDVLSRLASRIRHLYVHFYLVSAIAVRYDFPIERRIRQSVTEGSADGFFIVERLVLDVGSLVIAIAHVDSLFIFDERLIDDLSLDVHLHVGITV